MLAANHFRLFYMDIFPLRPSTLCLLYRQKGRDADKYEYYQMARSDTQQTKVHTKIAKRQFFV
jgi:hypothetical protein